MNLPTGLPLSLMSGESWEASRELLRKSYSDLILVSIAGTKDDESSFSADTGMGECLLIGRKASSEVKRATFVVLNERPLSPLIGSSAAEQIRKLKGGNLRRLEDGPVGGSLFHFGDDLIGYAIDAPLPEKGPWGLARIKDGALAQVAYQIADCGLIWLPGIKRETAIPISISRLSEIGQVGPLHWDITGDNSKGGIRGPFRKEPLKPGSAPTYPLLWSHEAARETCMEFEADYEGILRQGKDSTEDTFAQNKAARIWALSSHCHFNKDFRFNSQSTAMQFTSKKTIGGMAWAANIEPLSTYSCTVDASQALELEGDARKIWQLRSKP
jgi:hypothetical protein